MATSNWTSHDFISADDFISRRALLAPGHLILWFTALFVLAGLIWAGFARLDEVTRGPGRVIPSSQTQVIQNLEGGIVAAILVKEGDFVKKSQPLMQIDNTQFLSSYRGNQLKSEELKARVARLTAEVNGREFKPDASTGDENREFIKNEMALYTSRRNELNNGLEILEQQKTQKIQELAELQAEQKELKTGYELTNKELEITRPLVDQGAMSEVELLRLEREVNEQKGRLETIHISIPKAQAAVKEAEKRIAERTNRFKSETQAELNTAVADLARINELNLALEDKVKRTEITSPVNGTIKKIYINTLGGVIQPGMDVIEIVPSEDALLIEANIKPSDIAFLHPGQEAMVKITAYDFVIYGGLPAKVEHISADTITNERGERFYRVRLRTQKNYLGDAAHPLPIIPGMAANVDILTGNKTVLQYLLKPIRRAKAMALRER